MVNSQYDRRVPFYSNCLSDTPSNLTVPFDGVYPTKIRARVDFPAPDSPSTAHIFPWAQVRKKLNSVFFFIFSLLISYIANGKFTFRKGSLIPLVFGFIPMFLEKFEDLVTASLTEMTWLHAITIIIVGLIANAPINFAIIKIPSHISRHSTNERQKGTNT